MIPQIIPLTTTRRVYTSIIRAPQWHGAAQTHFPARPRKSQWRCDMTNVVSPRGLPSAHKAFTSHDTTNHPAHQRHAAFAPACFVLPMARQHGNALSTTAAQIPMALQHHTRRVATRSAHTLEANVSHDTTNHPADQRHAAFTPAFFALPSGTAPCKRTFHQGRANPTGTATSRTSCRHTVCPHTRSSHARVWYETSSKSHASRLHSERFVRDFLPKVALRSCKTSVSYETSSKSHTSSLQNERFVRDFLQKSRVKSPKRAFRTRLPPKVTRQVSKTSVSYETSSRRSHTSSLQKEHFVRDFLQKSSGNTHRSIHITHSPAKQFCESSPSKQRPLTRRSQCHSDIHLCHNSQPHDSLRLPRVFPRPHV